VFFLKLCGNIDIHQNEEIVRFMKGAFLERPALPKYKHIWDVNKVLLYLQKLDDKTLLQLSCKLSMLFLLVTAQRCQTLHLIETTDITLSEDIVTIFPNRVLKQTKPGKHLGVIKLKAFNNNKTLCVEYTLKEYLRRT
jgi:hypothetical protein